MKLCRGIISSWYIINTLCLKMYPFNNVTVFIVHCTVCYTLSSTPFPYSSSLLLIPILPLPLPFPLHPALLPYPSPPFPHYIMLLATHRDHSKYVEGVGAVCDFRCGIMSCILCPVCSLKLTYFECLQSVLPRVEYLLYSMFCCDGIHEMRSDDMG